jgi:dUTPase
MDSDYRGEYIVILINVGTTPKTINKGDKISQMVLCRHESPTLVEDNEEKSATAAVQPVFSIPDAASSPSALVQARAFDTTARGTGGFGSTGT